MLTRTRQEKIGGRPLWSPYCSRPSARFCNWCRGGRFRRRERRGHVFFDEIPDRHRDEERDQLRAPVFQRQSGPQDGNQYRAPVLRGLFLHHCCAAKFSARNRNHTPSRRYWKRKEFARVRLRVVPTPALARSNASGSSHHSRWPRLDSTVVIFEMHCSLNAPQVAAYVDSGGALANMLLSILLCISAVRKFAAQIQNFPISPKGIFPI